MGWLIVAGGVPGLFTLVFGLLTLLTAALQARREEARRAAVLAHLARATRCAIGAGLAGNLIAVFVAATGELDPGTSVDLTRLVLRGLAEALAPAVVGFTLLALSSMLQAVAARRAPPLG